MSEKNIEERIEELGLLGETRKAVKLTEKQRKERLELKDHPFMRKIRAIFREYSWKGAEKLRETQYAYLEKRKALAFEDIYAEAMLHLWKDGSPGLKSEEETKRVFKAIFEGEDKSKGMVV